MKKQLEENERHREKCLKKMHERMIHSCALIAGMCTFVCKIELHVICCYYLVLATHLPTRPIFPCIGCPMPKMKPISPVGVRGSQNTSTSET